MVLISTEILKSLNAKYVACLKKSKIILDNSIIRRVIQIIPQYTIIWTEMDILGAPMSAQIQWAFLDGNTIHQFIASLDEVSLIEDLTNRPLEE